MNCAADSLQTAVQEFQDTLTPSQKTELSLLKATPDSSAVLQFTAEIDRKNAKRHSRGVASRLFGVLESVRQFTTIIDTYVQAYPEIAALVWGTVKITILVSLLVWKFVNLYLVMLDSGRQQFRILLRSTFGVVHGTTQDMSTIFGVPVTFL